MEIVVQSQKSLIEQKIQNKFCHFFVQFRNVI